MMRTTAGEKMVVLTEQRKTAVQKLGRNTLWVLVIGSLLVALAFAAFAVCIERFYQTEPVIILNSPAPVNKAVYRVGEPVSAHLEYRAHSQAPSITYFALRCNGTALYTYPATLYPGDRVGKYVVDYEIIEALPSTARAECYIRVRVLFDVHPLASERELLWETQRFRVVE